MNGQWPCVSTEEFARAETDVRAPHRMHTCECGYTNTDSPRHYDAIERGSIYLPICLSSCLSVYLSICRSHNHIHSSTKTTVSHPHRLTVLDFLDEEGRPEIERGFSAQQHV
eukprot:1402720-Rhodomonas_salina.1